jgi:hypothetical protein
VKVADVAFLLSLIAGAWIASASPTNVDKTHTRLGFIVVASSRFRMVAGALLACGGLNLIIAAHWGRLFS